MGWTRTIVAGALLAGGAAAQDDASQLAETFVELQEEDRVALARLLELMESLACGDLEPGVAVARRGEPGIERGPLAAAFRTTLLFTAIEAGEDALADAIAQQVDPTLKEFLRDVEWIDLGGGNGFSIGIKVKSGTLPQGKPKRPKKPAKEPTKKSSEPPAKQRSTEQ